MQRGGVPYRYNGGASRLILSAACLLAAWLSGAPATAQTRAGTSIDNAAVIDYDMNGAHAQARSNTVHLLVAERLDVTLASIATAQGEDGHTLLVRADLTNPGTGQEVFLLGEQAGGGTLVALAVDRDGDGRLSEADQRLTDRTPAVAPGETLPLLVLVALAADAPADAAITLEARAATGSDAPGATYAGQGDDGSDAVVGQTGAHATIVATAGVPLTAPRLIKTQEVSAPGGGESPVPSATITYSLDARFSGPTPAVRIDDPVPAGTRFVPGSITLDGQPLSDTAGDDAGSFDGARVSVVLGDVPAPTSRLIRFQAIIP